MSEQEIYYIDDDCPKQLSSVSHSLEQDKSSRKRIAQIESIVEDEVTTRLQKRIEQKQLQQETVTKHQQKNAQRIEKEKAHARKQLKIEGEDSIMRTSTFHNFVINSFNKSYPFKFKGINREYPLLAFEDSCNFVAPIYLKEAVYIGEEGNGNGVIASYLTDCLELLVHKYGTSLKNGKMIPPTNDIACQSNVQADLFMCGRLMMTGLLHSQHSPITYKKCVLAQWDPVVYAICLEQKCSFSNQQLETLFDPLQSLWMMDDSQRLDKEQEKLVKHYGRVLMQKEIVSRCYTTRSLAYKALKDGFQYGNPIAVAGYNIEPQIESSYFRLRARFEELLEINLDKIDITMIDGDTDRLDILTTKRKSDIINLALQSLTKKELIQVIYTWTGLKMNPHKLTIHCTRSVSMLRFQTCSKILMLHPSTFEKSYSSIEEDIKNTEFKDNKAIQVYRIASTLRIASEHIIFSIR